MPRTRSLLVLLVLLSAPARAAAPVPAAECTKAGNGQQQVCSRLDASALTALGRSTTWTVWVEGGSEPLQVRLHNSSPLVVQVAGGDDQIVEMGDRRHRRIERTVTAVGSGSAKLQARGYSPLPEREAALMAAALAPALTRIEADFLAARAALSAGGTPEAVLALLDRTEAEVLATLSYQELAALRDYVREQFRRARSSHVGGRAGGSQAYTRAWRRVVLAAQISPGDPSLPWDTVFVSVVRCLQRLRELAAENDLLTHLCLTSDVPAARFKMRPKSLDQWQSDKLTTGEYRDVYRGFYVYSARKGLKTIECLDPQREACGPIDLVNSTEPVFHCDFASRVCERRSPASLPEGCRGRRE